MTPSGKTLALVAVLLAFSASLAAPAIAAAPNDEAALKLRKDAIETDFLAADYAESESKLGQALGMCGGSDCSKEVRARIRCDLGVLMFTQGKLKEARAAFLKALADDPSVAIDKDLASPPVLAAFAEAKKESETPAVEETPAPVETKPDPADCPPGFPNCPTTPKDTGVGEGGPEEKAGPQKTSFVSLALQQDFLLVPAATDACNGGNGYACFDGDRYYETIPLEGADNQVAAGLGVGTRRALVGYDHALGASFLVGVRLGYAFSGGPARPGGSSFLPLHAEVRGAYFLGTAPLATTGPKLFLALGAGLAQYDAKVSVDVYEDRAAYRRGEARTVDAWKKSGNAFMSFGLGSLIALGPGHGVTVEAKVLQMLATSASGFGLQLGYTFGL